MTARPETIKIYHIVNVDRLTSIVRSGRLLCDAEIVKRPLPGTTIGMNAIKRRRLSLPVRCYANAMVGEFVPFYFCPRSIMLYVIYRANHPDLSYTGGQDPIAHLEADFDRVVEWSKEHSWAFTGSNAGAAYAQFWKTPCELDQLEWEKIAATDWARPDVKEAKQSEFLMYRYFPWELVERIGVRTREAHAAATHAIRDAGHKPPVEIIPTWYY